MKKWIFKTDRPGLRWVANTIMDKICTVVFNGVLVPAQVYKAWKGLRGMQSSWSDGSGRTKIRIVTFVLSPFVVKQDLSKVADLSLIFSITCSIFDLVVSYISVKWYDDHHLGTGLMGHILMISDIYSLLRSNKQITEMQPIFVFMFFALASSAPLLKVVICQDFNRFWFIWLIILIAKKDVFEL